VLVEGGRKNRFENDRVLCDPRVSFAISVITENGEVKRISRFGIGGASVNGFWIQLSRIRALLVPQMFFFRLIHSLA
jgi:hypothetical protein